MPMLSLDEAFLDVTENKLNIKTKQALLCFFLLEIKESGIICLYDRRKA